MDSQLSKIKDLGDKVPYKDKLGTTYSNPLVKDEASLAKFTDVFSANNNDVLKTAKYLKEKFPYVNFDFKELEKAQKEGNTEKLNELFHSSGASNANSELGDFLSLAAKHNITSENINKYDQLAILKAMNEQAKGLREYKQIHPKFLESAKEVLKDQEQKLSDKEIAKS